MKISLILIIVLLLGMPLIFATTEYTPIEIKIYNNTIEIISEEYTIIGQDYVGKDYVRIFDISNDSAILKEFGFSLVFTKNESEIIDIDIYDDLITCLEEKGQAETLKGQYDTAWTQCKLDLDDCEETYEGENSTICKTDLDSCNLRVKEKDLTIESKNNKIETLEKEETGTKNTKYIYGVIALVVGYIICLYKKGEIGNTTKETSQSEMNPQQAG